MPDRLRHSAVALSQSILHLFIRDDQADPQEVLEHRTIEDRQVGVPSPLSQYRAAVGTKVRQSLDTFAKFQQLRYAQTFFVERLIIWKRSFINLSFVLLNSAVTLCPDKGLGDRGIGATLLGLSGSSCDGLTQVMIVINHYVGLQRARSRRFVCGAVGIIIATSTVTAQGQSPADQINCGQQAQKAFHNHNNTAARVSPELVGSNYRSHYSKKIGKCLILINEVHEKNGQMFITDSLSDAIERRELASFVLSTENGKLGTLAQCQLSPTFQEIAICSSRAEFDAFVSKYMEQ